ncbi:MAG: aromatic ring-hydroxylating dioxygenase subunit alpha [Rhodospirillales bacterium]|nr:aromatic ring-hydroxylating dioxygenase subunit alpha [Rhodospirillales bacterium]
MLSKEDNELLTRVGPGTPMGNLLRRFWFPAMLEREIAEPDSPPVKLRLLGEDLVAFKDTDGRIGILDAYCPHRLVHMYYGRNEECGLRCVYHGWKFDVNGNCVDMPSEPAETNFAHKVQTTSYPAVARGGIVWIYMGPKEKMGAPPDFEWAYLPKTQRTATKRLQECNWAQTVEGGIDSSHISFLHSATDAQMEKLAKTGGGAPNRFLGRGVDRHPVFDVRDVDYGVLIAARRDAGEENYYWRVTQCLMPFYQMIPPVVPEDDSSTASYSGHAWVPIDDENTWTWTLSANPHRDFTAEEADRSGGENGMWGPIDENFRPVQNRDNDYKLDRDAQVNNSFTGIAGIPNQDAAVQESMGRIVDRNREYLGQSDTAIIVWRRRIIQLAKDLADGKDPEMPSHPEWYNVRSCATLLKRGEDWQEGSDWLRSGGEVPKAAE